MILVMVPLTNNNLLTWSRSIRRSLAAKNKFGFMILESARESDWMAWNRTDEMVLTWIINSISEEIVETFVYPSSARKLWMDLEEQFGESNRPQIYQIQRQIESMEQGGLSVVLYYGKLKKLWEELNVLQPIPRCSCSAMKNCTCDPSGNMLNIDAQNKLIQFLIGLNDVYDSVRNQILVMDPLPSVNKAYSMVR